MVSLTPIILEEAEDEVVFEDDVGSRADEPIDHCFSTPQDIEKQVQEDRGTYLAKLNHLGNHHTCENNNNNQYSRNYHHNHNYKSSTHCSPNHESQRPFVSIREQIMNLRNMEQRQEARNVDKYVTPEGSPTRQHLIPDRTLKVESETHLQESPRASLGPTVFERSAVNAALPGSDVYTNVIRKPVLPTVVLAGDPYRDDTIDRKEHLRRGGGGRGGHRKSPRSCKAEARRQMSVPRCELTTDL